MTKECWTALELYDECRRLAKMIGPKAWVDVSARFSDTASRAAPAGISIYTDGVGSREGENKYIHAETFAEAFAQAETFCSSVSGRISAAIIRRMALAIIDITDRLGACSDLTLKAEKFTAGEIASYHIEACDAASRMSGNSPFVVTMSVGSIAA